MEDKILKGRDIISISDFSSDDILHLCRKAALLKDHEKKGRRNELNGSLDGKAMGYMFYEPSTRTSTSFKTAMRELGGQIDGFTGKEGTSIMKKESIAATVLMVCANHFDVIVMRHPNDGAVQWAADVANIPVINGGDGKNEHPTQALLDLFTLYSFNNQKLDNIKIGLGGDLVYGRTIRSLTLALSHFKNITVRWAAEDQLGLPEELAGLLESRGVRIIRDPSVEAVLKNVDFYYMTRPQLERMKDVTTADIQKIMKRYRIRSSTVRNFKGILLHPLPINSEIQEISSSVCSSHCQGFLKQAENGIFLRKALLYEILHKERYKAFTGNYPKILTEGNNKIKRDIVHGIKSKKRFVDNIGNGTCVDHIICGQEKPIADYLDLIHRGYSQAPTHVPIANKSFLKTNLPRLSERELKFIAIHSPGATINRIKNAKVTEKFVYALCENVNCITRVVTEDVPPKFYAKDKKIRCRYCRRQYHLQTQKLTQKEKKRWVQSLPKRIEPVKFG
jgi:aspartate carbamoyltransferase catalytic subunit